MKFKTEILAELAYDESEYEGLTWISSEIISVGSWRSCHRLVFKFEDKFYTTPYKRGFIGEWDVEPFEGHGDEVECKEVFPVTKTIIVYE